MVKNIFTLLLLKDMFVYSFKLTKDAVIRSEDLYEMSRNIRLHTTIADDHDIEENSIKKFISSPDSASESTLDAIAQYISYYLEEPCRTYVDFVRYEVIHSDFDILDFEYTENPDPKKISIVEEKIVARLEQLKKAFYKKREPVSGDHEKELLKILEVQFSERFASIQQKFDVLVLEKEKYLYYYCNGAYFKKMLGNEKSPLVRPLIFYWYLVFDEFLHLHLDPVVPKSTIFPEEFKKVYEPYIKSALKYPAFVGAINLILEEMKPTLHGKLPQFKSYIYSLMDDLFIEKKHFFYNRFYDLCFFLEDNSIALLKHKFEDIFMFIDINNHRELKKYTLGINQENPTLNEVEITLLKMYDPKIQLL